MFSFALTTSERPSLQAFWKRACLSSWGRSLNPVYLIYNDKKTQTFNTTHTSIYTFYIHIYVLKYTVSALHVFDLGWKHSTQGRLTVKGDALHQQQAVIWGEATGILNLRQKASLFVSALHQEEQF